MKSETIVISVLALFASCLVQADGIPSGAKIFRELDCTAQMTTPYQAVTQAKFRDVTYKDPQGAPWKDYNGALDMTLADGSVLTGVLNESNGVDPQELRDSAPTEDSGMGGQAMYLISKTQASAFVFITKSDRDQRDLPKRMYTLYVEHVDQNFQTVGQVSVGILTCALKQ